jgi:hypothetical protein
MADNLTSQISAIKIPMPHVHAHGDGQGSFCLAMRSFHFALCLPSPPHACIWRKARRWRPPISHMARKVTRRQLPNPFRAFNLIIANDHTFFVGTSRTWVHNACLY